MTTLFKEKTVIELLTTEIKTDFTQQQKRKLQFLIGTSDIVDYTGIKLLAKNIKNYLLAESYMIKHGEVLNILAKSYGFSNHHSMSASFERPNKVYKGRTNLWKIFQVKDELLELFYKLNLEFRVSCFIDKGLEFDLEYGLKNIPKAPKQIYHYLEHSKKYKSLAYQAKLSVNKLLRHYGIKPYRREIGLLKLYYNRGVDLYIVRNEIVKAYHTFFRPQFLENRMVSNRGIFFVGYNQISSTNDDLYVDKYYTDSPWTEIENFLLFLVKYGELEDYVFIESLVKRDKKMPDVYRDSLSKQLLLKKYEKFKFSEDFLNEYDRTDTKSLKSILESIKLVISISKEDMILLNSYAEDVSDVRPYYDFMNNLSELLMKSCIDNFNIKDRYEEIEKVLYFNFLHYDNEDKIAIVKSDNQNPDNLIVTCLTQLVETMCQRIEKIVDDNDLKIDTNIVF